jgi:hypothetical protein
VRRIYTRYTTGDRHSRKALTLREEKVTTSLATSDRLAQLGSLSSSEIDVVLVFDKPDADIMSAPRYLEQLRSETHFLIC